MRPVATPSPASHDDAAAIAAREAALDEELAAAGLRFYDELLDGMREGRYGGRPLHGRGPAALVLLLHLLEWRGDARAFAAAMPHFPEDFGVAEVRETLWRLGFASRVRRQAWATVRASDAPALVEMRGGRLCVMIVGGAGRRLAIDPTTGEPQPIELAARVRVVRFTPRDDVGSVGVMARLARFFGDHRREVGVLFAVGTMINALVIIAALGVRSIYDLVIPARGYDTLVAIGAGIAMAFAIDLSLRSLRARIIAHISARVATRVGVLLFDVLIHLPLERLKGAPLSAQINRIRQFEGLLTTLTGPVTTLIVETPFFLAMTLALYIVAGPLALIPLCVLAAHVVVAAVLLPGQRRREEEHQTHRTRFQNLMIEAALNAQALRAYGVRDVWSARLERAADSAALARRRSTARQRMVFAVANAANPAAVAATAALGAAAVIDGGLTVGELVAATMLVGRALAPLHQGFTTVWTATDLRATWSQVDRMLQFHAPQRETPAPVRRRFLGAVTLQRVGFRYGGSAETALSGLDLRIPAGAFVAMTGASGSGKSTLLRVLSGLSEPQAGTVFIDDVNIRQIPQAELRAVVGYAPDSPQLFHGTIAQNLRLAAPTASAGELAAICDELGLGRWIDALPEGIDTRLDHEARGLLPAGFRQTLATAQALLGDPRVLLLDQPATALDPELEAAMIAALTRRRGAMTIVMVTHRPSHVRAADFELRLDSGRAQRFGPVAMQKGGAR